MESESSVRAQFHSSQEETNKQTRLLKSYVNDTSFYHILESDCTIIIRQLGELSTKIDLFACDPFNADVNVGTILNHIHESYTNTLQILKKIKTILAQREEITQKNITKSKATPFFTTKTVFPKSSVEQLPPLNDFSECYNYLTSLQGALLAIPKLHIESQSSLFSSIELIADLNKKIDTLTKKLANSKKTLVDEMLSELSKANPFFSYLKKRVDQQEIVNKFAELLVNAEDLIDSFHLFLNKSTIAHDYFQEKQKSQLLENPNYSIDAIVTPKISDQGTAEDWYAIQQFGQDLFANIIQPILSIEKKYQLPEKILLNPEQDHILLTHCWLQKMPELQPLTDKEERKKVSLQLLKLTDVDILKAAYHFMHILYKDELIRKYALNVYNEIISLSENRSKKEVSDTLFMSDIFCLYEAILAIKKCILAPENSAEQEFTDVLETICCQIATSNHYMKNFLQEYTNKNTFSWKTQLEYFTALLTQTTEVERKCTDLLEILDYLKQQTITEQDNNNIGPI